MSLLLDNSKLSPFIFTRSILSKLSNKDLLLALIVIIVWGLNFVVIKVGVADVPPFLLAGLRFLLVVFPLAFFLKAPKIPLKIYLLYGLAISFGQFSFLFTAIASGMPSGLASLVLQSQAFFTLIFSAFLLNESWHKFQLMGLGLGAAGLILIGSSHGVSMPLLGFLLTICASVLWALGNIVSRQLAKYPNTDLFAFVVWAGFIPTLMFFASSFLIDGPAKITQVITHLNWLTVGSILYLAWAATLFGYGVWTSLMSRYPANKIAPFTLLVPVVGLLSGFIIFNETLQTIHFVGCAILMIGLITNVFGPSIWLWLKSRF